MEGEEEVEAKLGVSEEVVGEAGPPGPVGDDANGASGDHRRLPARVVRVHDPARPDHRGLLVCDAAPVVEHLRGDRGEDGRNGPVFQLLQH